MLDARCSMLDARCDKIDGPFPIMSRGRWADIRNSKSEIRNPKLQHGRQAGA